jgi:Concanavalin A-like lectin/glucanases superfamily
MEGSMEKQRWISASIAAGILGVSLSYARPAPADLSAGLVGYYTFTGNGNDNSGRGHHAGIVGALGWLNDRGTGLGGSTAVQFIGGLQGTDGHVYVGNTPDFDFGTGDFTYSVWLKYPSQVWTDHPYSAVLIRSGHITSPYEGPSVFADITPGKVMFRVAQGHDLTSIQGGLNDNVWRHFAFVRESGVLKIYIGGGLDSSYTPPVQDVSQNAPLILGANHINYAVQNFKGLMDELRIYNRALSVAEVNTLASRSAVQLTNGASDVNLQANRFQVSVSWGSGGSTQPAKVNAGATTDQTAYFYWTDPGNTEVIVKLLDFCSVNNTWSVYANGVTDREVQISITDRYSLGGTTWTGSNPLGNGFSLIRQVAFPCP